MVLRESYDHEIHSMWSWAPEEAGKGLKWTQWQQERLPVGDGDFDPQHYPKFPKKQGKPPVAASRSADQGVWRGERAAQVVHVGSHLLFQFTAILV